MPLRYRRAAAVQGAALLWLCAPAASAQDRPCDAPAAPLAPSHDLYCIELIPAPGVPRAGGRVELGWIPGPFTVSVAADGSHLYRPTIIIDDLPPPTALGDYATYVAWATTPVLHPTVRLGEVRRGRNALATIGFEKFLILVTAERESTPAEPSRAVVLRGQSPTTRLQPPDFLEFALGAIGMPDSLRRPEGVDATDPHAHHHAPPAAPAGDTVPGAPRVAWTTVPMPAGLQMLASEMALRPSVGAYLPQPEADASIPAARPREIAPLDSGDTLHLEAGLVRRTFKGREHIVYGFNGQYPGPLIQVRQGSEITVRLFNRLDQPTTVHWHGIRLENRFDGVPGLTQPAVPPGGEFTYRIRFPDAGIYWYHPHVREDVQQDLGLYGNMLVRSPDADWLAPVHREEALILDDLLVGADGLVPYGNEAATHALMGRFGNLMLVNGEPGYRTRARRGEVVRFYLTNVSNTRTLNLSFGAGTRLKVVGSDVGLYEREAWVESVVIAPAERYIVHVRFDEPGEHALVNRVIALDHLFGKFFPETDTLAVVEVARDAAPTLRGARFDELRENAPTAAEIARYRAHLSRPPDRALVTAITTRGLPFITERLMALDSIYFAPVEWSGTMPMMNWASTSRQVTWVLRDPATGRENMAIDWRFRLGDVVKLRLHNSRATVHTMQHPIHIHGQRFLVAAVNGVPNENLVWKDTVLLPAGTTVDLLLELSNPGQWMVHCHIAEHLSADMMMVFTVE